MIDKLSLIKQILETDEETDRKILSILEFAKENPETKNIHLIEERVARRKKVMIEVDLNTGKERILAKTGNISTTGAFIRTEKKIAKGEDIAIKILNPNGDDFNFVAKVMRVNSNGIGVMIKTITQNNMDNFTKFLEQL